LKPHRKWASLDNILLLFGLLIFLLAITILQWKILSVSSYSFPHLKETFLYLCFTQFTCLKVRQLGPGEQNIDGPGQEAVPPKGQYNLRPDNPSDGGIEEVPGHAKLPAEGQNHHNKKENWFYALWKQKLFFKPQNSSGQRPLPDRSDILDHSESTTINKTLG